MPKCPVILFTFCFRSSDTYKKSGLAPAIHRVRMCELAVDQTSSWLMVDPWEASQPDYTRTALVLEHFDEHLNGAGGIALRDGTDKLPSSLYSMLKTTVQ